MPVSILVAAVTVAVVFRYEVHRLGVIDLVQDRWAGTVSACRIRGLGYSDCYPYLSAGMVSVPKPVKQMISDEEFNRLLDNAKP